MGGQKIFCNDCTHLDKELGNFCEIRKIFIRLNKGRYCQDFIDKTKITKPKEKIPKPIKELEEAPVETKLELTPIQELIPTKKIKRVSLIKRLLNWLTRRIKWLLKMK